MNLSTLSAAECIVAMKALHNRLIDIEFKSGRDLFDELRQIEDGICAYEMALTAEPDPDAAIYNMVDHRYDDLVSGLLA